MEVDYLKLSEQYASFLAAVGGVSITVLTLVLSFGSESNSKGLSEFLVGALIVATISCFTGAHMMADTAAVISKGTASGERLFLLASANIFVAVILVLFALVLLPIASGKINAANITPISVWVFWSVVVGTVGWLLRAAIYRMPVPGRLWVIIAALIVGVAWGLILYLFVHSNESLLKASYIPIVVFTVLSLLYFTWTFKDGDGAHKLDMFFFTLFIAISYASLLVTGTKVMRAG